METLQLSNNGLYLLSAENIYFAKENKSYPMNEISSGQWIDILQENTTFSLKNNLVEIKDLVSYQRKVTYQILESFDFDSRTKLMLEYETKFANLLTEEIEMAEGWLSDAWNWTKDKVKQAGGWVIDKVKQFGSFAIKTGKDFITCITGGGCSPLFEDFREMLFSPVGIAIETFLTVTGIGAIGPVIAWGIMLLWDSYLLISGDPNFSWLNLIFDVLGVGFGVLAKGARAVFEAAGLIGKGGKLTELISAGLRNPKTAGFLTKFKGYVVDGLSSIMGVLQKAGKFLSEKLKITWVSKSLDGLSDQIAKILEAFGVHGTKATTQQGVRSALKSGGTAAAVLGAAHTDTGKRILRNVTGSKQNSSFDKIVNYNDKIGADYTDIDI